MEPLNYIEENTTNLLQRYNATSSNSSFEHSFTQGPPLQSVGISALVGLLFSIITVLTVVGNMLVILSVLIVKKLQRPSNYLLVSLAVSDLLVGVVVMPLSIAYYITNSWYLGETICSMWVSFDVMLCTASILNLLAISVDRYLVITRPFDYARDRSWKHIVLYIFLAWVISILTCTLPLMVGWNVQHSNRHCRINEDVSYQIYATSVAFFGPLLIMCTMYGRIFYISSQLAAKDAINRPTAIGMEKLNNLLQTTSIPDSIGNKVRSNTSDTEIAHLASLDNNNSINDSSEKSDHAHSRPSREHMHDTDSPLCNDSTNGHAQIYVSGSNGGDHAANGSFSRFGMIEISRSGRYSDEVRTELPKSKRRKSVGNRQAIRTLGIIMGLFTVCWLPFFVLAVVRSICVYCFIPDWVTVLLTWLGYANSALNPLIYAIFTREFRTPFRELMCCRWTTINESVRHTEYEYKYGRGSR